MHGGTPGIWSGLPEVSSGGSDRLRRMMGFRTITLGIECRPLYDLSSPGRRVHQIWDS